MKNLLLLLILLVCTSFNTGWPCHPNGDVYACLHPAHGPHTGICNHYDSWGNRIHDFDYYPCIHPLHAPHIYPCTHYCY